MDFFFVDFPLGYSTKGPTKKGPLFYLLPSHNSGRVSSTCADAFRVISRCSRIVLLPTFKRGACTLYSMFPSLEVFKGFLAGPCTGFVLYSAKGLCSTVGECAPV